METFCVLWDRNWIFKYYLDAIKSSQAHSRVNWLQVETDVSGTVSVPIIWVLSTAHGQEREGTLGASSHITTLMMGTEIIPETSVSTCNQLTRLCAREDFFFQSPRKLQIVLDERRILSLSEGRAGIAWEPFNYKMLSLSLSHFSPNIFSLLLLFWCPPSSKELERACAHLFAAGIIHGVRWLFVCVTVYVSVL
jgi:hypothetical protein